MATQAREPNTGLIAMPDGFQSENYREIATLAARYRLPALYSTLAVARAGGLLAYSNDIGDNYRRAAAYVDAQAGNHRAIAPAGAVISR